MKVELLDCMGNDSSVVNAAKNKTHKRIIEAKERGYSVTNDGRLFGPRGEIKVSLYGKQRYPTFSTNWGGFVYGLPIHVFAAYTFYGDDVFRKDLVIRHLNGNTLDFSKNNIVLGTYSENNLDKPKNTRIASAKKARASQGIRPSNAKLNEFQVKQIREIYSNRKGKKFPNGFVQQLCKKYGATRTTLSKIVKGDYYASYFA